VRRDGLTGAAERAVARYALAFRTLAPWLAWAVAPLAVTVFGLVVSLHNHPHFGGDFHAAFWPAGHDVLHGHSPYVAPSDPRVAKAIAFVYPAPAALVFAPFAAIPRDVADALFIALTLGAVAATLWLLSVRDWRVYGAAYLWAPVASGWLTGNVTLMLVLAVAGAWRWRDRPGTCGALVGSVVAFKLFLWPLGLWLIARRRYRALGWGVAVGGVVSLAGWAILGFGELRRYDHLVHALVERLRNRGFTLMSLSQDLVGNRTPGYVVAVMLALTAAVLCLAVGRRGRDRDALTLSLVVALLATPLVWLHYFALFLVPAAVARPTMSAVWKIPLIYWLCVAGARRPETWQVFLAFGAMALLVATLLSADKPSGPAVAPRSTRGRGPLQRTPPTWGRN
jgi:hypothetical protein